MFMTKMKSLYHTFTISEMKIADYLLDNKDNLTNITSNELAAILGVGQSTIIRFSQKIGYRSYKHLISDVIEGGEEEQLEIQAKDSTYATMDKMVGLYNDMMKTVMNSNSPDDVDAAVNLLSRAGKVVCYGFLGTGAFAQYMANALIGLGKNAFYSSAVVEIKHNIMFLDPDLDVVVLLSKTGETEEVNDVAQFAKDKGIAVIAVSNITKNTLMTYADVHLKIIETSVRTRLQSFSSNAGLLYMVDAMTLNLYKKDYARYRNKSGEFMKAVRPNKYKDDETDQTVF